MFNAANILEALKNYIRTRGGTSNAYNIAEAVNDLNSIPEPENIPSEVINSVETNGMGWTDKDEVVHKIDQKYIPACGIVIETETNTTVGEYQAPNPTVDQITAAYNAVVSAVPCTLTDALGLQHFVVNQADTIGDIISISILYYMEMIITYSVENNSVVITHYDIGNQE